MGVRLTGVSIPIGGVSWEYTDEKKQSQECCTNILSNRTEEVSDDLPYNFDGELDNHFQRLSVVGDELYTNELSPLQQMLRDKIVDNIIRQFIKNNDDTQFEEGTKIIETLIPQEMKKGGKSFSVIEKQGEKTLIFGVYKYINSKKDVWNLFLEPLRMTEEKQKDRSVKRTYYVDDLQEAGNRIVTITLVGNLILINDGILIGDMVSLTKKPTAMFIEKRYDNKKKTELDYFFPEGYYDDSAIVDKESFQQIFEDDERIVEAEMETKTLVIDVEKQEIVLRQIIYDEEEKRYKSFMKISPNRNYFAVQLLMPETEMVTMPLSTMQLGRFYRKGIYEYPKDIIKAVEYFEKEGTPESQYEIFKVFFEEETVRDEKIAMEYLEKSVNSGYPLAKVQLALLKVFNADEVENVIKLLDSAIEDEFTIAKYLKATLMELGLIKMDKKEMLSLYYEAAREVYKPAQYRLSSTFMNWKWEEKFSKKMTEEHFWASKDNGEAEYCLGSVLLWGLGVERDINRGLEYLEIAVAKGNENAKNDLREARVLMSLQE